MNQIKIATKEESFWVEIKESTEKDIERLEKLLKFQKAILDLAESKLEAEREELLKHGKSKHHR